MTGWEVYGGTPSVPAGMLAELAALRAALPGYDVILTSHSPARRSGAIRRDPGPGPWCVVSTDPAGLWRELAGRAPPPGAGPAGRRGQPAAVEKPLPAHDDQQADRGDHGHRQLPAVGQRGGAGPGR